MLQDQKEQIFACEVVDAPETLITTSDLQACANKELLNHHRPRLVHLFVAAQKCT